MANISIPDGIATDMQAEVDRYGFEDIAHYLITIFYELTHKNEASPVTDVDLKEIEETSVRLGFATPEEYLLSLHRNKSQ